MIDTFDQKKKISLTDKLITLIKMKQVVSIDTFDINPSIHCQLGPSMTVIHYYRALFPGPSKAQRPVEFQHQSTREKKS
jgi:hypothetical protein